MKCKSISRLISFMLVISMIMGNTVFANSDSVGYDQPDISYQNFDSDNNIVEQLSSYGDVDFYFYKTDEYTFATQVAGNGFIEFSIYYPSENRIETGTIDLGTDTQMNFSQSETTDNLDVLDNLMVNFGNSGDISKEILYNLEAFETEQIFIEDDMSEETYEIEVDENGISTMASVFVSLQTVVNTYFESTYANKFLMSKSSGGVTCRLTEAHTIYTNRTRQWNVLIGTAVSVLVSYYGLPIDTIWDIISWGMTGAGVYQTTKSFVAELWNIEDNYTKTATINNGTWYWSAKTQKYYAPKGDKGFTLGNRHYNVTHPDFNNNTSIVNTALDNYHNW